ncbi:unnamed protein product [Ectocarpus sp. CCAP 1310/34]|nr:unnamed protein product [Ectocarpus sp. CCAP 1310/34]
MEDQSGPGDAGDGAPSSRESASVAPSTTSTGTADVGGGEDDRRSSSSRGSGCSGNGSSSGGSSGDDGGSDSSSSGGSSGDDGGSDSSSSSGSETDLPALRGPEARRLARFDKPAELTSRRSRENPRRNPRGVAGEGGHRQHDAGVDVPRLDVSFAVRAVARHAHAPAKRHWDAIQKILGYLKGTRDLGITYQRGSGIGLAVYVDASYADTEDTRSVSGLATTVGGTVVSHGSKTQRIVSLSSTKAEYIAAEEGVKEALFVRAVLSFVAPETSGSSIEVLEDNQGAIALV